MCVCIAAELLWMAKSHGPTRSRRMLQPVETGEPQPAPVSPLPPMTVRIPHACQDTVSSKRCTNIVIVAKTFATFCHHFSDVCSVSTTASVDNTATNNDAGPTTTAGGQVTVTVTQGPASTTNAAATARVGLAAGVIAVAGFALMV